ncbi:DNA repair protein Rev1 [Sergentomyia squamirostris]
MADSEEKKKRKRPERPEYEEDNGFAQFGGYMEAKISKLEQQFAESAKTSGIQKSNLFSGVSIFVNGHTNPSAEALKVIMMEHGGVFHQYERSHTTFIIASNLPDVKVRKMMPSKTIIRPEWVVDCVKEKKILDHKKYLYDFNHKVSQPKLLAFTGGAGKDTGFSEVRTAVNPNFLSEFYNNSRLHHISTLGLTLKDYVNELREKHSGDFPGREDLKDLKRDDSGASTKFIMHIDMDCFFVSVGLRSRAHLRGLPVAVTHSKGGRNPVSTTGQITEELLAWGDREVADENLKNILGTNPSKSLSLSEIASCSYEARAKGIKNGMFMGTALKLCPDLQTIPYDFDQYREVSYILYNSISKYTLDIEAVSCDEMFVDLTNLLRSTGVRCEDFVSHIRSEIRNATNCPCSVGIGGNRLLARLATRKAKPDGQYFFPADNVLKLMEDIHLKDLPGVGYSTFDKLKEKGLTTCGHLQKIPLVQLQKDFPGKSGENLYNLCRGEDNRPLNFTRQRKSVSTEVNYGIRFTRKTELETFLKQLCEETSKRLREVGLRGKSVTLKLMIRAQDAPVETAKFMGHGICDHITKSASLPGFTDDPEAIFRAVWRISEELSVDPAELRGIGVQVTKLSKQETPKSSSLVNLFNQMKSKPTVSLPEKKPMDAVEVKQPEDFEVDPEVLKALPPELREEIVKDYANWTKANKKSPLKTSPEASKPQSTARNSNISANNILSKKNWMKILTQWVNSSDSPKSCDVEHLSCNAVEFIRSRNICDLYSQLEYLRLIVDQKDSCFWHTSYKSLIQGIQVEMLNIYEIQLKITDLSCKRCK